MKRIISIMMVGLVLMVTATAQTTDRIPTKGFAVFSANDTFHYFFRNIIK